MHNPHDPGSSRAPAAPAARPAGTSTLAGAAEPSFGQHGGYPPAWGWLLKGYTAITENPAAFLAASAPVDLGMGSSQVRSVRYWMRAFKLADEHETDHGSIAEPTGQARWLFGNPADPDGADPYLEDDDSLWLLHWQLLAAPCAAPSWWIAFHRHGLSRLEPRELEEEILREAADAGWKAPARSSAARDASCFIRMYGTPSAGGPLTARNIEDAIRSPFAALTLLTPQPDTNDPPGRPGTPGHRAWRLPGAVRSMPGYGPDPRIIAYACLDYAARDDRARSVAISRLAHEPGSPGRAFRLSTDQITNALIEVAESRPQIAVACSTGEDTLMIHSGPLALAGDLLADRYGRPPPPLPRPRRLPARRAQRSTPAPGQASLW